MRSRSTIEFPGLREKLCNPDFKPLEFERFKNDADTNYFVFSPQRWIESTQAIGITSKSGRYGGTNAHRDIAFQFASWISPEINIYLIVEFQRLKDDENERLKLGWNFQRAFAKPASERGSHGRTREVALFTAAPSKLSLPVGYARTL